jgi:hypothetical protein
MHPRSRIARLSSQTPAPPRRCEITFNEHTDNAHGIRGTVSMIEGCDGVTLAVNGETIGFVDLYETLQNGPAQLVLDGNVDDILAKLVLEKDRPVLVVNGLAEWGKTEHVINAGGWDNIYAMPKPRTADLVPLSQLTYAGNFEKIGVWFEFKYVYTDSVRLSQARKQLLRLHAVACAVNGFLHDQQGGDLFFYLYVDDDIAVRGHWRVRPSEPTPWPDI